MPEWGSCRGDIKNCGDAAMTQNSNGKLTTNPLLSHRSLLRHGLAWLGGVSMLSSGIALAQTEPSLPNTSVAVPSAQDLLAPALQQAPSTAPEAVPEPSIAPAPAAPVTPQLAPSAPSSGPEQALEAPPVSRPSTAKQAAPLVTPNLADRAGSTFSGNRNDAGNGNYIDPSGDYSLGATTSDSPSVVLSERSTGCQVMLQPGQTVPASVCPEYTTAAISGSDSPTSVNLGPLSLSVTGIGVSNASSGRDFYNLTVRPPAMFSNGNLKLVFPLSIPAAITSAFGWRVHPVLGESRFHSGTDLGAPMGTPVVAAFSGNVVVADFMGGYGLAVVLQHKNGTEQTLYGHLSEVFVKPGETIKQGDVVGRVGSTGLSTGPHLHFEFRELTPQGWVVVDSGKSLEYAMAQLDKSLKDPTSWFHLTWASFEEALKIVDARSKPVAIGKAVQPQVQVSPSADSTAGTGR